MSKTDIQAVVSPRHKQLFKENVDFTLTCSRLGVWDKDARELINNVLSIIRSGSTVW